MDKLSPNVERMVDTADYEVKKRQKYHVQRLRYLEFERWDLRNLHLANNEIFDQKKIKTLLTVYTKA